MKKMISLIAFLVIGIHAYTQQIQKWKIADVEKLMTSSNGDILVLNFWATFCKPCVAEIPSFISIAKRLKSEHVKLQLVSLDLPSYYPKKIDAFIKKHKFYTNIAWLEETNADYFCPKVDSSWSGSIPATLILNTKTGYRKFFEGEIKPEVLESELTKAISK